MRQRIRASLWRLRFMIIAVAAFAAVAAIISSVRGLAPRTVNAVVATHAMIPGTEISDGDVELVSIPEALAPPGIASSTDSFVGGKLIVPVGEGMPLTPHMTLSEDLMSNAPPGSAVVPVTVEAEGIEALLVPGRTVALYAPPTEFSAAQEAQMLVPEATIVGLDKEMESDSFSSETHNKAIIFVTIPKNAVTVVLGYGSTMSMRVVVVK